MLVRRRRPAAWRAAPRTSVRSASATASRAQTKVATARVEPTPAPTPQPVAPPVAKPAPPKPQPPKPFPEGAKVGFVDLQIIASTSAEGKAASAKIQQYQTKANAQISEKTKEAQGIQQKLQQGGTVLSDQARLQAEKDLQRLQRELQAATERGGTLQGQPAHDRRAARSGHCSS